MFCGTRDTKNKGCGNGDGKRLNRSSLESSATHRLGRQQSAQCWLPIRHAENAIAAAENRGDSGAADAGSRVSRRMGRSAPRPRRQWAGSDSQFMGFAAADYVSATEHYRD